MVIAENRIQHCTKDFGFLINVRDMQVGDIGYTLPWAVCADEAGLFWWKKVRYWILGDYPVSKISVGTFKMKVERMEDGYHVWYLSDRYDGCMGFEIGGPRDKWKFVIRLRRVWWQGEQEPIRADC